MTVPSTPSRNDYIGTGLLDAYDFSFRITSEADLLVTKQDTLGVSTTLTYPTDYTVTGVGDFPGGTITLTAGNLPTGYLLAIRDDPALVQTSDIRNQGDFFPEIHEDAFDYVTRIVKSQQDTLDRAVKLSETTTGVSTELPAPEAGYSIVWNATADGLINAVMASAPTSAFMATALDDETAADARTTLGVPAAANGTHTGTTAVQTLNVSVAATVPTPTAAGHSARKDYVDARLPAGFVSAFAGGTAPTGWLECDGSSIAVASYPDLHAAIGYTYGGSGASFNLPDLRGEFIRGWDHGRGVDSGRAQGSSQADLLKSHNHITVEAGSWPYGSTTPNEVSGATYTAASQAQAYTSSTGGTETRPRNVALMHCIKA